MSIKFGTSHGRNSVSPLNRSVRSGITEIRAGRSNGARGKSSRTGPFSGPAVTKNKIEITGTWKNHRVVFRALVNARIIAMATREFAIGSCAVSTAYNVNSFRSNISITFEFIIRIVKGSTNVQQVLKWKKASLIHKYSYYVNNLSISFSFFVYFQVYLLNRIQNYMINFKSTRWINLIEKNIP